MSRRGTLVLFALLLGGLAPLNARSAETSLPSQEEIAKLPPDGGEKYNRLIFEKSPYLLQHAANPVDWHPWGGEAFELARREDKPVFLSIGYSTCHWCHVMERESFEDAEVAALLNRDFVCVKVDREERPDIDAVYMEVTVGMTGSGGWPMTVILTPDKHPFFAGTYFPKGGNSGRPGLMELLPKIVSVWKEQRAEVLASAEEIRRAMDEASRPAPAGDLPGEAAMNTAFTQFEAEFDDENGGFGLAPKFPTPHQLMFLLRWWKRSGDAKALEMVEKSLNAMRRGGIFDHVGLGFHRYSTDPMWRVPHFEKMLYDQAMLMMASTEAWQATGRGDHARVVREIFDYVSGMMTSPDGAFYCAEDADSEGEEGKFYLWTAEEFGESVGKDDAELFGSIFNVKPEGNFQDEASGHPSPRNILYMTKSWSDEAAARKMAEADLRARWETARGKLIGARNRRVRPLLDDKVLADWNGLMIAALARAGAALDDPRMIGAARRAADFVLAKMRGSDGRLLHRWRGGEAGLPAHLDDYALMSWGLTELYEADFDVRHLRAALELTDTMMKLFPDAAGGGFFMTAEGGEKLPGRKKEHYDGAIPSGNSIAAINLLRLGRMTGRTELESAAGGVLKSAGSALRRSSSAHTMHLCALDFILGPSFEVVLAGDPARGDFAAMRRELRGGFFPNMVVLHRPEGPPESPPEICALAPFTKFNVARDGKATAYVCRNYACHAPTTDPAAMLEALKAGPPAAKAAAQPD